MKLTNYAALIVILVAGCTPPPQNIVVKTQPLLVPPQSFVTVPDYPTMPRHADRTNREMYLWRVELQMWACDVFWQWYDLARYKSGGQQLVEPVPIECKYPQIGVRY